MAGCTLPGPVGCQGAVAPNVDDGTMIRQASPHPGSVGGGKAPAHLALHTSTHATSGGQYRVLRLGSKNDSVRELQTLLNARLSPSPGLQPDGVLGARTNQAVLQFQRAQWLLEDGVVGRCTWNALRRTESYVVLHEIDLVGQPTPTTCWEASASMILRRSITVPPFMLNASGALLNDSELNEPRTSAQFCRAFGLRLYSPQSWTAAGLAAVVGRGPVMCNVLWNVEDYVEGRGSDSHWVVFAGVRGDQTAEGTTIRVYNPLPVNRGSIVSVNYAKLISRLPAATYQLFQRGSSV